MEKGDSNEYPQHMFLWRSDENYPSIIIKYHICSTDNAKNAKTTISSLTKSADYTALVYFIWTLGTSVHK